MLREHQPIHIFLLYNIHYTVFSVVTCSGLCFGRMSSVVYYALFDLMTQNSLKWYPFNLLYNIVLTRTKLAAVD